MRGWVTGGSLGLPTSTTFYLDEDMPQGAVMELVLRGYGATYARWVLPPSTSDDDHLAYAAEHGSILVTRNRRDFELLHHAWRSWARLWEVDPDRVHFGILITPGQWHAARIADAIDAFFRSGPNLTNALYLWTPSSGWERRPDPP